MNAIQPAFSIYQKDSSHFYFGNHSFLTESVLSFETIEGNKVRLWCAGEIIQVIADCYCQTAKKVHEFALLLLDLKIPEGPQTDFEEYARDFPWEIRPEDSDEYGVLEEWMMAPNTTHLSRTLKYLKDAEIHSTEEERKSFHILIEWLSREGLPNLPELKEV